MKDFNFKKTAQDLDNLTFEGLLYWNRCLITKFNKKQLICMIHLLGDENSSQAKIYLKGTL